MYTDENCAQCGSCLQGCPTNSGKSTINTYIHHNLAGGALTLRADSLGAADRDRGPGRRASRRPASSTSTRAGAPCTGSTPTWSWRRAARCSTPLLLHALGRAQPRWSVARWGCTRRSSCSGCSTSRRTPTWSRRSPATACELRGRRRRRVRGRGGDHPGPDRVRGQPVRRERSDVGPAARRRRQALPALGRAAEHVKRRQQRAGWSSTRTAASGSCRDFEPAELERIDGRV